MLKPGKRLVILISLWLSAFGIYLALVNLQSNIIYGILHQEPHQSTLGILTGMLIFASGISAIIWWLKEK